MGLCVTLRYNITMGCCSNLVRVFLIISNVILAVLGLLTIAGGLWLTFDQNNVKELFRNWPWSCLIHCFFVWMLWCKEGVSVPSFHLYLLYHRANHTSSRSHRAPECPR